MLPHPSAPSQLPCCWHCSVCVCGGGANHSHTGNPWTSSKQKMDFSSATLCVEAAKGTAAVCISQARPKSIQGTPQNHCAGDSCCSRLYLVTWIHLTKANSATLSSSCACSRHCGAVFEAVNSWGESWCISESRPGSGCPLLSEAAQPEFPSADARTLFWTCLSESLCSWPLHKFSPFPLI